MGRLNPKERVMIFEGAKMDQEETSLLREGERIDDLQRDGYRIIQHPKKFCFGVDAVFLTDFVEAHPGEDLICDLGTGTGIIPLLLCAKGKGKQFTGLEIQPDMAEMAQRSVKLNHAEEKIRIVNGDIREALTLFGASSFDAVTVNPPYMQGGGALVNPADSKAIARHEILVTLEDVIRTGCGLLKDGGRLYMVHRPNRLTEIITLMHEYHLEPQRLQMVHSYTDQNANLVMVEGRRGRGAFLKVLPPVLMVAGPKG